MPCVCIHYLLSIFAYVPLSMLPAPEEEWSDRMGVVMSARVHPGESNSSWMMQGVIEFLTSEHKQAKVHFCLQCCEVININLDCEISLK